MVEFWRLAPSLVVVVVKVVVKVVVVEPSGRGQGRGRGCRISHGRWRKQKLLLRKISKPLKDISTRSCWRGRLEMATILGWAAGLDRSGCNQNFWDEELLR